KQLKWGWISYWIMAIGTIITTIMILVGESSVLYTLYTPLKAHPLFYIVFALVIIGSWISAFVNFRHFYVWKRAHRGEQSQVFDFMVVINMAMWVVASLGVAISVVALIMPWSLGMTATINVLVTRTLFWYCGHPFVYFWLLPAYM